jgi:hypothetical protein
MALSLLPCIFAATKRDAFSPSALSTCQGAQMANNKLLRSVGGGGPHCKCKRDCRQNPCIFFSLVPSLHRCFLQVSAHCSRKCRQKPLQSFINGSSKGRSESLSEIPAPLQGHHILSTPLCILLLMVTTINVEGSEVEQIQDQDGLLYMQVSWNSQFPIRSYTFHIADPMKGKKSNMWWGKAFLRSMHGSRPDVEVTLSHD